MRQSCQSQSWSELEGASQSVSLSLQLVINIPSMSLPSRVSGIAWDWTSVGEEKFCCATAWRSRESRPRALKLEGFLTASFVETAVGTSSSSSLRFMVVMGCNAKDFDGGKGIVDFELLDFEISCHRVRVVYS